jgi:hypothetical protein
MSKTRKPTHVSTVAAAELIGVTESYVRQLLRRGLIEGDRKLTSTGLPFWKVKRISAENYRKTRAKTAE